MGWKYEVTRWVHDDDFGYREVTVYGGKSLCKALWVLWQERLSALYQNQGAESE